MNYVLAFLLALLVVGAFGLWQLFNAITEEPEDEDLFI